MERRFLFGLFWSTETRSPPPIEVCWRRVLKVEMFHPFKWQQKRHQSWEPRVPLKGFCLWSSVFFVPWFKPKKNIYIYMHIYLDPKWPIFCRIWGTTKKEGQPLKIEIGWVLGSGSLHKGLHWLEMYFTQSHAFSTLSVYTFMYACIYIYIYTMMDESL